MPRPTKSTRIFVRDDDVGDLTPTLVAFAETFLGRRIPVSYQIIPDRLSQDCAEYMLELRGANPGLVEFGQHGLRHEMNVGGRLVYREFGPERSYKQQLADILAGQEMLRRRLGDQAPKCVFTPPQHRYNRDTLKALNVAGFTVLSASAYPRPAHRAGYAVGRLLGLTNLFGRAVPRHGRHRPEYGLFELSIAVAADDAVTLDGPAAKIIASVRQARRHTRDVGVMFHHGVYEGAANRAVLERLLDELGALPGVTFHGIEEISGSCA